MYLTYQRENWFQTAGSFWESASTTVYYVIKTVGEEDWFFCWVIMAFLPTGLAKVLACMDLRELLWEVSYIRSPFLS
jgi:hypothetical protein